MTARVHHLVVLGGLATLLSAGVSNAQGRGGGNWTTTQADAQRSGWVRSDGKVSVEALQQPAFQFLWKATLDNLPRQLTTLTQPLTLRNIISYKGFKALAFVGGSDDRVFAIDYDLNRMFWERRLSGAPAAAASVACPGGLSTITRQTNVAAAPPPGGRGFGFGGGARPGGAGRGAAPAAARGRAAGGGPQAGRAAGGGRAAGQAPATPGRGGRGRGGGGGNDRRGGDTLAIGGSGMVYRLNPQTGDDAIPPVRFLPAGVTATGSILIDGVLYAATTGQCGGAVDGVHALDMTPNGGYAVVNWTTGGAPIVGTAGPAFGTDGTSYVATADGAGTANAVVALEAGTLGLKATFTADSPFTSSPVVFPYNGRDHVAVTNSDGRLYLLDSGAMAQAVATGGPYASGTFSTGALTTWEEADGTRWILVPSGGAPRAGAGFSANGGVTNGTVLAFKVVDQNGRTALEPAWASRDLVSPVAPMVMNDVVFALSSGEFRGDGATTAAQRAEQSGRAVLYALDGATGRELWNSGQTITSFGHEVSPSGSDSQVYVVTHDGTLYAFGMPMAR